MPPVRPVTLAAGAVILAGIAGLAIPATRVTRMDPVVALRAE
jgi:ABC-type antimicrobial peptide transport system permease subunit